MKHFGTVSTCNRAFLGISGSGMNGVEEIRSHAFFKGIDWNELSKRS